MADLRPHIPLLLSSLEYTKRAFQNSVYPTEALRSTQINTVQAALDAVRAYRDEAS